ncbi:restriction endonuclease subunit S [Leisingera aquaemixtae]|uniref:restriction endonuclease subunit S n=1 Tax=Leisingera aquaemixtae TaxID=1396826 RepID=UPI0021A6BC70|nr:restriction endonuclease subunit S [Leisingera aquaemixtae]UWQ44197.1 restriction endonuclease subunit S [Leisingera aquaemixtae]
MSWRETNVGEFVSIKHGFAFKSKDFSDAGSHIVLTPGNCHNDGGFKSKGDKEKWFTGEVPPDYLLSEGDLIVVMTDLVQSAPVLGGAFKIPDNDKFLHNQRLGLVQIKEDAEIHSDFLYHLFNTHAYRGQVRGSASGATVRHTSPGRILDCCISVPDLPTQERIAGVLSAYDDLIENNRRRIALLEQAARLLYREWFVHFRFPGYETAKFIDGLPEGWVNGTLGDLMTLKRGYDLPASKRQEGDIPIVSSSGITGYHKAKMADGPGIVTGRYGTIGEVYFVDGPYWPLNTALYVSDKKNNPPLYLFHALKQILHNIQSDKAAVPGVNRNVLHEMRVGLPPRETKDAFEEKLRPISDQKRVLTEANKKLAKARDLLLPRLMDGRLPIPE